jgi:hypothetical protein
MFIFYQRMSDYNSSGTLTDNHTTLIDHIKLFNDFLADKLDDREKRIITNRLSKYGSITSEVTHISYIQQLSSQVHTMLSASTENLESLNKLKQQLKALKKDSESSPIKKSQYDKSVIDFNKIKNSYEILSYDQIHELLIELEKVIIRTIPYKLSPVFLLGRITQQLLIIAGDLEEQCMNDETGEFVVNEDALIDCESSFEVVTGLINTTLVQAKNIKIQLKQESEDKSSESTSEEEIESHVETESHDSDIHEHKKKKDSNLSDQEADISEEETDETHSQSE